MSQCASCALPPFLVLTSRLRCGVSVRLRVSHASDATLVGELVTGVDPLERSNVEQKMWSQISIDIVRTHPNLAMFQDKEVQKRLLRLLFVWSVRHPASGYVQGINDLVTPFFVVFVAEALNVSTDEAMQLSDVERVCDDALLWEAEADAYWCVAKLLDGIQDHYTHAQPGVQLQLSNLQELVYRVDRPLYEHLAAQEVSFLQFAFRWMVRCIMYVLCLSVYLCVSCAQSVSAKRLPNDISPLNSTFCGCACSCSLPWSSRSLQNCILMRELSMTHVIRLWDTYLCDDNGDGFGTFHVFVCGAFLVHFSSQLRTLGFAEIIQFLQNIQSITRVWTEHELELLLAQAYSWQCAFTPRHLGGAVDQPKW